MLISLLVIGLFVSAIVKVRFYFIHFLIWLVFFISYLYVGFAARCFALAFSSPSNQGAFLRFYVALG